MCTVTFIARQRGYCLGMNRDERLTRPEAFPTKFAKLNGRAVIGPSEPSGGKWIAVNDRGVTFALLNWYSAPARVRAKAVSRGEVVHSVSAAVSSDSADAALAGLPLHRINPFRLIGIVPTPREIIEWRWNLRELTRAQLRWKMRQWISSGFDEPAAQRVRTKTFRQARRQRCTGSLNWLRRLHRSHSPEIGPFSTCMHRAEAATVSYTEVIVSSRQALMRYHAGPLCQDAQCSVYRLQLR